MPAWLISLIEILVFSVVILFVFKLLRDHVLSKLKVNKWVVLGLGVLVFLAPVFMTTVMHIKINPAILNYVQMPIFVLLFLWYMDLMGIGAYKNVKVSRKDDIKIRPKAKPNRVKHLNDK